MCERPQDRYGIKYVIRNVCLSRSGGSECVVWKWRKQEVSCCLAVYEANRYTGQKKQQSPD